MDNETFKWFYNFNLFFKTDTHIHITSQSKKNIAQFLNILIKLKKIKKNDIKYFLKKSVMV